MKDYFVPFEAGACFHVFTHGVGDELVFREPQNYVYFLGKYKKYISPVADTFAYSLLPSHFHICIRFKSEEDILSSPKALARGSPLLREDIPKFLMQQFSNFLNSYAKSVNKFYGRMGALFCDGIRRVRIEGEEQLIKAIHYIHFNPVKHGLCRTVLDWPQSSLKQLMANRASWMLKEEVWELFGGRKMFLKYHEL